MLTSLAPAKINLVLEVLGRRGDGYHEIRSLIQTVSLCDVLSFELDSEIAFRCTESSLQTGNNLVVQAAELLREVGDCDKGARIELEKRIPWGAGLGGGSSDAAATLLALNKLWELGLTASDLVALAARLGSDVPFFIQKGTSLLEGRGEKVTLLPDSVPSWYIMMLPSLPKLPYKTQQLYSKLHDRHFTGGHFVSKVLETWPQDRQISSSALFNIFDKIAFDAFPGLEVYWRHFEEAGASDIHLVGSGPALFAPMDNEARAGELHQRLCQQGLKAYLVSTIVPEVI